MECRGGNDSDEYIYLDPKLLKRSDAIPKTRAPFQDAIVFVVGGGNYIEYQNLVDFIKVSILIAPPPNPSLIKLVTSERATLSVVVESSIHRFSSNLLFNTHLAKANAKRQ